MVRRSRRGHLAALFIAAVATAAVVPPSGFAAMVTLQYRPPAAPPPASTDLMPIAPFDAAWNPPTAASTGGLRGNTIPRPGDPSATTNDYVEYWRTQPQGVDEAGPLRGSIMVDFDKLEPGLPAIVAIHGGLVAGPPCSPDSRRLSQALFAREFAAKGYIVFLPDLTRPTNDKITSFAGVLLSGSTTKGDCMADDGWEPGAKRAQISLQLSVRSLKRQLALFADAHPGTAAGSAFAAASRKVVAFGGSSGGHFAARLALRSEDSSGAPDDGPQFKTERRVAAAAAIGAIGECTPNNPVRNFRKAYGLDAFPSQYLRAFSGCGPVTPGADDAPIRFWTGLSAYRDWWTRKWKPYPSPLSGSGGWGTNLGWDNVADARWPKRTCEDLGGAPRCIAKTYLVDGTNTHANFPHNARPPGTTGPTYWQSTVLPEIDAFFRTAKSDDDA